MLTFILVVTVLILFLWSLSRKPHKFPPGPRGLPIVGNAPSFRQLHRLHYRAAAILAEKYGPVVGVKFGWMPIVFISGYEACKEILNNDNFNGRPFTKSQKLRSFGKRLGMVFVDGEFWREQRRFTLRHMKEFGFGRNSMESVILEEVGEVVEEIKEEINANPRKIVKMSNVFGTSIINILWAVMAGKRYNHNDPELSHLLKMVEQMFRSGSVTGGILNFLPQLRFIAPKLTGYSAFLERLTTMQGFIRNNIDEHKRTFDSNHMRDFIDVYLAELQNKENVHWSFTEEQLITLCMDMFSAGSETTSAFLRYAIMYMVLYPEVQNNVQEELDSIIGKSQSPSLEDKPNLPYTDATLMEVLRVTNISPFTVPHATNGEDATFRGYIIPKDAMVLINFYTVHMDKDHWKDPENFRPERFISEDGSVVKDDWLMPFGIGKRNCLGEPLARRVIFIFFTTLLKNFKFSVAPGESPPDTEPLGGMTIAPKPFSAKVELRT